MTEAQEIFLALWRLMLELTRQGSVTLVISVGDQKENLLTPSSTPFSASCCPVRSPERHTEKRSGVCYAQGFGCKPLSGSSRLA